MSPFNVVLYLINRPKHIDGDEYSITEYCTCVIQGMYVQWVVSVMHILIDFFSSPWLINKHAGTG